MGGRIIMLSLLVMVTLNLIKIKKESVHTAETEASKLKKYDAFVCFNLHRGLYLVCSKLSSLPS